MFLIVVLLIAYVIYTHRGGAAWFKLPTFGPTPVANEYTDARGYQRYTSNDRLVHREVAAQKLGRKLCPEEVVHHRDRNKQNNDPRNLWVFKDQAAHDAQHRRDAEKYGEWWSYNGSGARRGAMR